MRWKSREEFKERSLIVQEGGTAYVKDEQGNSTDEIKGRYVTAQLDQSLYKPDDVRTGKKQVDANPYLASMNVAHPNGGTYVNHKTFVQESQWQAMVEAAGKKSVEIDGKTVLGIKADIIPVKSKEADVDGKHPTIVIPDTSKPMGPSKNPHFGKTILTKQDAVTKAAKEYAAEQKAAKTKGMEAQAQNEAQTEAEAEAPEIG